MRWSKSHLFTLREAPADAEIPSHQLMVRAGFIRKAAPGIYTYGHLALRAINKLSRIVREELDRRGCQEILMPMVHPAELWQETGRWSEMGESLLKLKNRSGHDFCLGATHEEVVTDYIRRDIKSYRDLPQTLYQIQTKYRDEIRPRFGLMRGREFIMKDAYSFDTDEASALAKYREMYEAYHAIFKRIGVRYRVVEADAGSIGGSRTHEFQLLADSGEDHLMVCSSCDFAANIEVAPVKGTAPSNDEHASSPGTSQDRMLPLEAFPTPGLKTIADLAQALSVRADSLVKTLFYSASGSAAHASGTGTGTGTGTGEPGSSITSASAYSICVLVRGSDELNPVKLKNLLGLASEPVMLTEEQVKALTGAWPGSCGPVGLTIPVYADHALVGMSNFVVGANRDGEHLKNVNFQRDFRAERFADLRVAKPGDDCPRCETGHYTSHRGIEAGHVFYLGSKYSEAMSATYLDRSGQAKPIQMGCYGIGISRLVQAVIEQSHDDAGMVWPLALAPYQVHLTVLDPDNTEVMQASEIVYRELQTRGHETLMDDREERPGVKFKDADLIGFPVRLNIGGRGLQSGEVEIIIRRTRETRKAKLEDAVDTVSEILHGLARR